jgi:predicted nucleic acid-binding protein
MRQVFADTSYWIAVLDPRDQLHDRAAQVSRDLGHFKLVTTEMVLTELLNFFADNEVLKNAASVAVRTIVQDPNTETIPQTSLQFRDALDRYIYRTDKEWSLTDCASLLVMEQRGISEALTYDHHFEQAGFRALLRD